MMSLPRLARCIAVLAAFGTILPLAGCRKGPKDLVPVSGKLTYAGGQWPKPGMIFFSPASSARGEYPKIPGRGDVDADGNFVVHSAGGEGLLPGDYNIGIHCWKVVPTEEAPRGESFIPKKFLNGAASGLSLKVEPGSSAIHKTWDIPKS